MKVKRGVHKSRGGLIRCDLTLEGNQILKVTISGDFFLYPEEALEDLTNALKGLPFEEQTLLEAIERVYADRNIVSPGCTPLDFTQAIMKAGGDG
jgi:hypothetical protein